MRGQELCAGVGTQSRKTTKLPLAVPTRLKGGGPAPEMPGPSWPWTMNAISSSFPREAPAQIITVGCASVITSGQIQLLPFAERLGNLSGDSNWCTMISGTMILQHRHCWQCCYVQESRFRS